MLWKKINKYPITVLLTAGQIKRDKYLYICMKVNEMVKGVNIKYE